MKKFIIFAMLALAANDAFALDRITASSLKCDAIKADVSSNGQAILHYSRANPSLYDRIVADDSGCGSGQRAVGFKVQSSDFPNCEVQICRTYSGRGGH